MDIELGNTYLIIYTDHHDIAMLCTYIKKFLGMDAARLWFKPEALDQVGTVTFYKSSPKKMNIWKNWQPKKSLQQQPLKALNN
jgi:hypothetical protein